MSSSKEKFGKSRSWKDTDKIVRLCLINIYQGKIVQPWGTIIHLITKLQLLALNFKFTYKFLPESTTPITDFTNLVADIFIFKDLFSFTDESDLTKVVFVLVHVYNFILIAILLYLSSLVIRKKPIDERFQSFWSVAIYLHCLIFIFPSFNFSVAGIVDWANGDLKIFSPSSVNQVLVPVFSLLTLTWNGLLIVFSNVFLMTSLRSNGPLCLKTNTLQRIETIEKCLLFLLSYAISDMEITSWIVLIASLLIILSKNFYVFSLLPYYEIQIQTQETIMNSLIAPLATLNVIAKAIARTKHILGSSEIIIAWLVFCPFAAKFNWNRLYKIYSTLLGAAITATSPGHILHRIPLYNLFLKRKIDFNPKADTVDFTNLYIKGKSKIMKPYVKETGEEVEFDLANDQHFKIYSLSLLKDGIKLHNNYWPMKVAYIRQLIEHSYYIQALYFIEQTKKGNLDLTRKIMLHLLKSEIECILMRKYLNQKSEKLNILKFLRSTYIYDKLRHEIMQQLQNQQGFWYSYLPNKTNFKTLINFSNKIDFKKSKLEKFWKQYESSVEENFVSPYLTFGVYLELANYRPTRGSQVIKQYLRKARGAERTFAQDELSNDTIFASDNVCIEISGVKQTLGIVLECSHSVRKVFGFNRDHMIGQNVEMIIPDYLKDKHNSALYRYYETGKKSVLNHTRQVLAMTSSGYLLPTYLHVRLNPFLENKISYVGLMRPVKQNRNCFIVLPDGTIDGLTKEIAAELNLTPNLKLSILEICSEFQTVNEVTNRVAHHELAKKQDFQMLFKNVNKMSQASPRKPRGSTLTKTIGHEDITIVSPSITDRKLLVTSRAESRADVTTPSKSIVSKVFSNIFLHNSIQNLDYESVLQLYSKYSQEGVEVTFRCFPGHRESSYEGIRELKAQIRVENMIMGHDFVKVVYINTILEKKMEKPMTRRRGAVTLTKLQSMQSDSSKGQEEDRGKALEMLYKKSKDPIASVLNNIKISSQSSSGDINEDIGSPFKLNTFRAQGDPDASPIKSSLVMKEETHESLERNNPSVPHMNYKITVNSESNMSPTNRQKSSRELQGIQIASKQIKELSEIESKNDEEDPENNRNIEIKNGKDNLSQKENRGDSKDVKNMVQFNDRASRDGLSSEQSIKLKIQKGVESSLEVRHKSKKFAFFIIAFVLCMALIALVLLSQMLSAMDAFTDVSNSNQIITFATGMLDSLVYANFMLRIWYCLIEGKFGYIPEPTYSALMEGQREGMEGLITTLSVANSNLTSAVTMLDEDLQNAFYVRNVRVFEVDKDVKPGEFTLDNTFTAIQKIVSKGFRFLAAPSYPIYQPNLEMLYFLYNCYNDLLISNENSVSILLADMQGKISSYKETLWSVSTSSSIILILFLISSLIIVYQMKKSVLNFGVFFFTINHNDVKSILASLNNFHKVLNHNYQDEVLLAHLQVSEENHKHKGDQAKIRPSEKDILYNQYHLQNQLLVSRLWILVGLVMGLLIGFTAMKLNDIDHITKLHEQSVASGDNLVKSNLVVSILVELAGANETTTIKNLPIVDQFQIYLKSLSQSGDLINAFKDNKGQIEPNKAEFLSNFSCNSYIDDLSSDDLNDFRAICYNVSGQQGYTSVITLNNQIWQLANDLYTSFSQSNRTAQDQVYFLATGEAQFPPMINVGRVLNFELWRRVLTDFELFLESRRSQTIAFSIYFEVLILIITLFAFPWALTILNNKDYELKKMLKLVPLNVILKNRWLKTYLIKHSNKILDPIKNIL